MAYKVIDIEGVGAAYAEKLAAAGVVTAANLLEKCAAPAGRKALAEETGISDKLILKWTNHADLFRVKGVGPQFAELLEAAGVDTVKELAHRRESYCKDGRGKCRKEGCTQSSCSCRSAEDGRFR